MSVSPYLHRYPFLRLLLPLVVGIVSGDALFLLYGNLSPVLLLFFVLLPFVGFLFSISLPNRAFHGWTGAFVALFLFSFGFCFTYAALEKTNYSFPEEESVYNVRVVGQPEEKENSIFCRTVCRGKQVLLYFPKDSAAAGINLGDQLLVSSRLALPRNNGNPGEFNYRRYLLRKGVTATGYVASGKWKVLAHHSPGFLKQTANDCRDGLLRLYRNLGFRGDAFAVLSALTIGYKEELSEEIRESFSVSGGSHLLALSGLHIGFLYLILLFFLRRLTGNSRFGNVVRIVLLLLALWSFAFVTGLSPSVVRSVTMFSLLGVSQLLNRHTLTMNSVLIAAFVMLCVHPFLLFDVGFQLSFTAVLSILTIHPLLQVRPKSDYILWQRVRELITVSIAAQIGTAPLVLFYFSRFPTHFLLTNLLAIPLVTLIIYLAVVMLMLTPVAFLQEAVAWVLKRLLALLNGSVRWVEALPFSSLDGVWFGWAEVVFCYLFILFSLLFLAKQTGRRFAMLLVLLVGYFGYDYGMKQCNPPCDALVFYNVRNCPVVHCISSTGRSWISYADSLPDSSKLVRPLSAQRSLRRLSPPESITASYRESSFARMDNLTLFADKKVCFINGSGWAKKKSEQTFPIDYLYICKGYSGNCSSLLSLFPSEQVLLDASLSFKQRERLMQECDTLGVSCHSLSEGSFVVNL